ncbi:MAG: hypothetical protein R3C45_07500 [Phycisphaerales bacterium]
MVIREASSSSAAGLVDFQADEQFVDEDVGDVGQERDRFEERVDHHGHGDVELEDAADAAHAGHGDGRVVADDPAGDLHDGLADDGVDLAGHDGRPGLDRGQVQLTDPAARAGAEVADVVGDFA